MKNTTKKITSILLVLTIILSCFAFVGCDEDGFFLIIGWKLPEGATETVALDRNGNEITIAHSVDFAQDDIDFVLEIHNSKIEGDLGYHDTFGGYNMEYVIRGATEGDPVYFMHFEDSYIICGYRKPNQISYKKDNLGDYNLDVTKYVWYKFDDPKEIPKSIGGAKLTEHTYLIYDCTVVGNMVSGDEYEYKCKYYLEYEDESSFYQTSTDMIIYLGGYTLDFNDDKFILAREEGTRQDIYIDEQGIKHIVFVDSIYHNDTGHQEHNLSLSYFGEYFEILYPYMVRNEALDEVKRFTNPDGSSYYRTYEMKQIEVSVFVDLLFNQGNVEE